MGRKLDKKRRNKNSGANKWQTSGGNYDRGGRQEADVQHRVLNNEVVLKHIAGKEIKKVIYVKDRLISIVV